MSTSTILSIAFPFAPVGPAAIGGAEVLLSQLEAAMPTFGFQSVVVAHAASRPAGRLYPVPVPETEITEAVRTTVEASVQAQIDRALAENPVALVHMHGLDFTRYRIPAHLPVLVTLHLPLSWYPETLWHLPEHYTLVCVSETQRRACPGPMRERMHVVGNGVPLPDTGILRTEGRYALMLARICPEKNLHTGLDAARLAGMPAMLAGEVFPYETHQRYFADEIQPRLTHLSSAHTGRSQSLVPHPEARFLGPVTGAAKTRLFARAACLLLPSLAPETSSLVAMEALASGVPVVAMASGAVPEILEHGRTGFLVPPGSGEAAAQAMANAIGRLHELSRQTCRQVAAERFTLDRMLARYGELYRQLALSDLTSQQGSEPLILSRPGPSSSADQRLPSSAVHMEHLTSTLALDELLPAWSALWRTDPHATPFQHPAWLRPWWQQFGPDGELHALCLRTGPEGPLAGLVPLYTYTPPGTADRQLLLMGAGTTDYLDGIWSPDLPETAGPALAQALHTLDTWDHASLFQLRTPSPLLHLARAQGFPVTAAEPTSVLDLAADLPAKLRANAGRYRRRAQQAGALALSIATTAAEALDSFDHLLRFHQTRWNARGEAGVLSDPRVQVHHRAAIPALLEAGLLRFFRLTLGGELLGVLYALADSPGHPTRSLYLYLIGFDTTHADLSPGTLLLQHVWEYARAEHFAKLDFLRGGEGYKHLWGTRSEPTFGLNIEREIH